MWLILAGLAAIGMGVALGLTLLWLFLAQARLGAEGRVKQ
jgi:hypothetical protein